MQCTTNTAYENIFLLSAYYHLYRLLLEQVGKCRIKDVVGWIFVSLRRQGMRAETYHLWTGRRSAPVGLGNSAGDHCIILWILFSPDSTKRMMRPGEELQKGREVSLLFFVSDEAAGAYREYRRGGLAA